MDEDDDAFLYGETNDPQPTKLGLPTSVPQPVFLEAVKSSNGVVPNLETHVVEEEEEIPFGPGDRAFMDEEEGNDTGEGDADADAEEDEEGEGDESEDDIEIIMEPTSRSLDFRQNANPPSRPQNRSVSATNVTPIKTSQPSLTTEYTPRERGAPTKPAVSSYPGISQPSQQLGGELQGQDRNRMDEGPDPSTLPPASAPPSHPAINPSLPGTLDGRSILDVDLNAMAEKPWRRPGSDISDWFNYGFDEISWEAYCYRRRDLGELANVLKANVLNFAGMPEDQLTALPPELRTMVMTGANAMMSGAGPNPNMMGPAVGMNPMMDMSGMGPMNMGPMGMGMNGDLAIQMQAGGPMMQEAPGPGPAGPVGSGGTPEQGVQMGMQDGFGGGGPGPGMMGMGMGGDYGMQQEQATMGQQMYPGMEGSGTPVPGPGPSAGPSGRGAPTGPFRGRAMGQNMGMRGRGGFTGRGRGRGMYGGGANESRVSATPAPVRPASPLPPNVPTGPRNQNKYKDRDGNAPAVDGLDYGGNAGGGGGRTPSGEPEERGQNRKRRSSPGLDDGRGLKRR